MDLNCHVDKDAGMTYNRVNTILSMFFSVFIIDVTINRQRKERGMDKKPRKTEKRQLEIVRQLRPIDDCFFEVMMEDPDACEELLQVVLENPLLRIKKETVSGQKSIRIIGKRSIRVDAYAEGNEDTVFNIEIQTGGMVSGAFTTIMSEEPRKGWKKRADKSESIEMIMRI